MGPEGVPKPRPGYGADTDRSPEPFPRTPWTQIANARALGSGERGALERLFSIYWRPVYWHIRYQWRKGVEDAKDLAQEYFATFLEKGYLDSYDRERGRFRTFVKVSLDNFLRNRHRAAGRMIRGGHVKHLSIDVREEPPPDLTAREAPAEESFDRAWAAAVLQQALLRLREHYGKRDQAVYYELFVARETPDGEAPTYEALAERHGVSVSDVRNYLHHARVTFRSVLRVVVGETVVQHADVDDELDLLRELF